MCALKGRVPLGRFYFIAFYYPYYILYMKRLHLLLLTLLSFLTASAQLQEMKSDRIASLQVVAGQDWLGEPIIYLGGDKRIHISFDDLSHDGHRYSYSITHCEPDWTDSEGLFTSDYLTGFQNGQTIEDCEESVNTNQLYTHYSITLPNASCRILMSGNYRVDITDEDEDEVVASARFMVCEDKVRIAKEVLVDTDIDVRRNHQQVNVSVQYPSSLNCTSPRDEFRVMVMQNHRTDNMVCCPSAPQLAPNTMIWTHTKSLIFPAGNEYHKFEILDVHRNSLGVESLQWDGEWYNVHIYHDYPRKAYVYDEDANGSFYLRNSDNVENDITSEYVIVHFYFDSPELPGDLYVSGRWTTAEDRSKYLMRYDQENCCYHAAIPLKYGYYSYQYVLESATLESQAQQRKQPYSKTSLTEGDFFQTENQYCVLVYYKNPMDRTWRLVGAE